MLNMFESINFVCFGSVVFVAPFNSVVLLLDPYNLFFSFYLFSLFFPPKYVAVTLVFGVSYRPKILERLIRWKSNYAPTNYLMWMTSWNGHAMIKSYAAAD